MNCACVLDANNKVVEMCGAHWAYVRTYVAPYTPPEPRMETMLMMQSTQRLQYIHCLEPDAARWRYCRESTPDLNRYCGSTPEEVDAAIDAAILRKNQTKGEG